MAREMAEELSDGSYVTALLILTCYPINELNTLFIHHYWNLINPWIDLNYPIYEGWFVKWMLMNYSKLQIGYVVYRLTWMNKPLRIVSAVYLILLTLDMICFFIDFNTGNYLLVYSSISLLTWVYVYPKRVKYKRRIEKTSIESKEVPQIIIKDIDFEKQLSTQDPEGDRWFFTPEGKINRI